MATPASQLPQFSLMPPAHVLDFLVQREVAPENRRIGYDPVIYRDSEGFLTGGVGHRLTDVELQSLKEGDPVTPEMKDAWLQQDMPKAWEAAQRQAVEAGDPDLAESLFHVNYQLGTRWNEDILNPDGTLAKKGHTQTWGHIKNNDYLAAAAEAPRSDWFAQTPTRVRDLQRSLNDLYNRAQGKDATPYQAATTPAFTQQLNTPPVTHPDIKPPEGILSRLGDEAEWVGKALYAGAVDTASLLAEMVDFGFGDDDFTDKVSDYLENHANDVRASVPDWMKKSIHKDILYRNEQGEIEFDMPSLRQVANLIFESAAPGTAIVGGGKLMLKGLTKVKKLEGLIKKHPKLTSAASIGGANSTYITAESYRTVYDDVLKSSRDEGMSLKEAHEEAARAAAFTAGIIAPLAFTTGALGEGMAATGKTFMKRLAKGLAAGSATEAPEESGQYVAEQIGKGQPIDPAEAAERGILGALGAGPTEGAIAAIMGKDISQRVEDDVSRLREGGGPPKPGPAEIQDGPDGPIAPPPAAVQGAADMSSRLPDVGGVDVDATSFTERLRAQQRRGRTSEPAPRHDLPPQVNGQPAPPTTSQQIESLHEEIIEQRTAETEGAETGSAVARITQPQEIPNKPSSEVRKEQAEEVAASEPYSGKDWTSEALKQELRKRKNEGRPVTISGTKTQRREKLIADDEARALEATPAEQPATTAEATPDTAAPAEETAAPEGGTTLETVEDEKLLTMQRQYNSRIAKRRGRGGTKPLSDEVVEAKAAVDAEVARRGLPPSEEVKLLEDELVEGTTLYRGWYDAQATDDLRMGDLGVHLAPDKKVADSKRGKTGETGEYEVKVKNPLRVTEEPVNGAWHDPERVLAVLDRAGLDVPNSLLNRAQNVVDSARGITAPPAPNSAQDRILRDIRKWVRQQGYDSIIYNNEYEGGGDSVMLLDPKLAKLKVKEETTEETTEETAEAPATAEPEVATAEATETTPEPADDVERTNAFSNALAGALSGKPVEETVVPEEEIIEATLDELDPKEKIQAQKILKERMRAKQAARKAELTKRGAMTSTKARAKELGIQRGSRQNRKSQEQLADEIIEKERFDLNRETLIEPVTIGDKRVQLPVPEKAAPYVAPPKPEGYIELGPKANQRFGDYTANESGTKDGKKTAEVVWTGKKKSGSWTIDEDGNVQNHGAEELQAVEERAEDASIRDYEKTVEKMRAENPTIDKLITNSEMNGNLGDDRMVMDTTYDEYRSLVENELDVGSFDEQTMAEIGVTPAEVMAAEKAYQKMLAPHLKERGRLLMEVRETELATEIKPPPIWMIREVASHLKGREVEIKAPKKVKREIKLTPKKPKPEPAPEPVAEEAPEPEPEAEAEPTPPEMPTEALPEMKVVATSLPDTVAQEVVESMADETNKKAVVRLLKRMAEEEGSEAAAVLRDPNSTVAEVEQAIEELSDEVIAAEAIGDISPQVSSMMQKELRTQRTHILNAKRKAGEATSRVQGQSLDKAYVPPEAVPEFEQGLEEILSGEVDAVAAEELTDPAPDNEVIEEVTEPQGVDTADEVAAGEAAAEAAPPAEKEKAKTKAKVKTKQKKAKKSSDKPQNYQVTRETPKKQAARKNLPPEETQDEESQAVEDEWTEANDAQDEGADPVRPSEVVVAKKQNKPAGNPAKPVPPPKGTKGRTPKDTRVVPGTTKKRPAGRKTIEEAKAAAAAAKEREASNKEFRDLMDRLVESITGEWGAVYKKGKEAFGGGSGGTPPWKTAEYWNEFNRLRKNAQGKTRRWLIEKMIDRHYSLRLIQETLSEEVVNAQGRKVKSMVNDPFRVWEAMTTAGSITGIQIDNELRTHMMPIAELAESVGVTKQEVSDMMAALHSIHRNEYVLWRNSKRIAIPSYMSGKDEVGASGVSYNQAAQVLADLGAKHDVKALYKLEDKVQDMAQRFRDILSERGLVPNEVATGLSVDADLLAEYKALRDKDSWRAANDPTSYTALMQTKGWGVAELMQNLHNLTYVPLSDIHETTVAEALLGKGLTKDGLLFSPDDVHGHELKTAEGRQGVGLAQDTVSHLFANMERAIIHAVRNEEVSMRIHNLATELNKRGDMRMMKAFGPRDAGFYKGDNLRKLWRDNFPKDGTAAKLIKEPDNIEQYVIRQKHGDKETMVMMFDAAIAHTLLNTNTKTDVDMFFNFVGKPAGVVRKMFTSWNPAFTFTNYVREVGNARIQARSIRLPKSMDQATRKKVEKALTQAVNPFGKKGTNTAGVAYYKELANPEEDLNTIADPEMRELRQGIRDLRAAGMHAAFHQMKTPRELQQELEKIRRSWMKPTSTNTGYVKHQARRLKDFIERTADASENGVRVAVALELRKQLMAHGGMTAKEANSIAASEAQNLSVNFQRFGEWGSAINTLYFFYNPSIQGLYRSHQALRHIGFAKVGFGIAGFGAAQAILNRALAGEDDEGRNLYETNVPAWKKQTNMIMMIPGTNGNHVSIPLPYIYNVPYYVGEQVVSALFGSGDRLESVREAAEKLPFTLTSMALANISPIRSSTFTRAAIPSLAEPFYDVKVNRSWFGTPISPERNVFDKSPVPDAYNVRDPDQQKTAQFLAQMISTSDEFNKGVVDISPGTLEYLYGYYTGGAGMFIPRLIDSTMKMVSGEVGTGVAEAPIVRRFFGLGQTVVDDKARYYDLQARMSGLIEQDKTLRERKRYDAGPYTLFRANEEHFWKSGTIGKFNLAEKRLRKYIRQRNAIRKTANKSERDLARIEALNTRIHSTMLEFNKEYYNRIVLGDSP